MTPALIFAIQPPPFENYTKNIVRSVHFNNNPVVQEDSIMTNHEEVGWKALPSPLKSPTGYETENVYSG